MPVRPQLLFGCLVLVSACTRTSAPPRPAAVHAQRAWNGVLPDGTGGAPLPAPDLALFVDRDGRLHPVNSDPICMRSGMRVRLYVDAEARGEFLTRAFGQLAGCDYLDLAGGPDGAHGVSFDHRIEAQAGFWPLRIILFEDGFAIGRQPWRLVHTRLPSGAARTRLLEGMARADRALYSETVDVALSAANGVRYAETFGTLLAAYKLGYVVTHLSGERSGGRSAYTEPVLPAVLPPPVVPTSVRIDPEGAFWLEGTATERLPVAELSLFLEVVRADSVVLVAVPRSGAPVVLGARPLDDDPVRRWIFGLPVLPAPADYVLPAELPAVEGVWSPFILRKATG